MSGIYAIDSTKELIRQYFNNYKHFTQLAARQKDEQFEADSKAQTLADRTHASAQLRHTTAELFMDDFSIIARSSEKTKAKPTIKTMFKSFTGKKPSEGS